MLEKPDANAYIDDILLQPECLRRLRMKDVVEAVEPVGRTIGRYKRVLLTGMGSSHAALRPLWLSLVEAGNPAWLVDAAECLGHFTQLIDDETFVIAASQSGRSAELVALSSAIKQRGGKTLAITNDKKSPLAQNADAVVDICVGIENAVSTKTYLNTLGVCIALDRIFLGKDLDDSLERTADALETYLESWKERTERLKDAIGLPERLYFLARGRSLAAAEYGALIVKEAAKWPVEAQSVPQFRHGPLELADERLTTIIFAGREMIARAQNRALYTDLASFGARSFWLDEQPDEGPLTIATTDPDSRPLAEAVPLQLLSLAIAELSGIRPGSFRHLKKITTVL